MMNEGAMAAAKRELSIPLSISVIQKNLEILYEWIRALQDRLNPICRSMVPSEKVAKLNKGEVKVPLAVELVDMAEKIRCASDNIGDIIDSLEL